MKIYTRPTPKDFVLDPLNEQEIGGVKIHVLICTIIFPHPSRRAALTTE